MIKKWSIHISLIWRDYEYKYYIDDINISNIYIERNDMSSYLDQ